MGFPGSSASKESACSAGDPSSISRLGRSPGGGMDIPVLLGFPGGSDGKESACNAGDLGLILGWEDPLDEVMAIHSSILVWRIPMSCLEDPGGLQSMGSQRVKHDRD